jgi:hypothetical protein
MRFVSDSQNLPHFVSTIFFKDLLLLLNISQDSGSSNVDRDV